MLAYTIKRAKCAPSCQSLPIFMIAVNVYFIFSPLTSCRDSMFFYLHDLFVLALLMDNTCMPDARCVQEYMVGCWFTLQSRIITAIKFGVFYIWSSATYLVNVIPLLKKHRKNLKINNLLACALTARFKLLLSRVCALF